MDAFSSDSDWESFSDSGSSEQEEIEFLYGGQAQSIFSSLEESIIKIDDFLSFERGFKHGDLVCSLTDPSRMGRVFNLTMFVDLENLHEKTVKEVNSKELQKIRAISVGDYVVHGAWVGKVEKVVDKIFVNFDDGSKSEILAVNQEKLVPISPNLLEDSQYSYYPGQRVQVGFSNVPKSARWLCGNWRENQDQGTVCAVEAGLVYVDWLASALGTDFCLPAPPRLQDPKYLTLLSCFSHANWQLGDWCILPSPKSLMEQTLLHASGHGHQSIETPFQRSKLSSSLHDVFVIVKTKTKVDVIWQDGNCSSAVDSQMLLPIGAVNDHEFWPYQFVLEKDISDGQKWGVVQAMDAEERTVKLWWKSKAEKVGNGSDGHQKEDTVSAYELVGHPEFSFCFGDVVFREIQSEAQPERDHTSSYLGGETETALKDRDCSQDRNQYPDTSYLSCIGIVAGFKDGAVEVNWAIGSTTKVAPYEIYRINKYEESVATVVNNGEDVLESNQEMIQHNKGSSIQQEKDLINFNGADENSNGNYLWNSTSFFFPRAAIGIISNIAARLFGSYSSTSLTLSSRCNSEDQSESDVLLGKEVLESSEVPELTPSELQMSSTCCLNPEEGENKDNPEFAFLKAHNSADKFRQFDMVSGSSDHHFLDAAIGLAPYQVKRGWLKKVQQEWSILETSLPDTIYVRVYEERMDLLRAALVGAPGTPYHDALFVFDIFLPPEYPHEPPSVHYRSGGLRVNPNLYESGKVCLSLLNTWTGTGSEVWNPENSTILQVLLSLQSLVLNERPYFNEAGYDKQIGKAEGEKNSLGYNENAFLVTLKSMLYIIRRPPMHFEALVEKHFKNRGRYILMACEAYLEGTPVGYTFACGENQPATTTTGGSTGFKLMLAKLYPKLAGAFTEMGIDCGHGQSLEQKKVAC